MVVNSKPFYLPWVDGLRAIAALAVVVHHGPTLMEEPFVGFKNFLGWFGVDLFLVLSAFLLSRLLQLEYVATGAVDIKKFFVRRMLRIWPLYLFFITASLIYGISNNVLSVQELSGWYLAHLTFTQNLAASVHSYSPFPFAAHLWTIALEEQAYLVMPIFIAAYFREMDSRRLAKILVLSSIVFMVIRISVVLLGREHPYIWVSPLRADTFLFGIYLGLCTGVGSNATKSFWLALSGFACAFLIIGIALHLGPPGLSGMSEVVGYPMTGVLCCLLIFAIDKSTIPAKLLSLKPMRHLGKISYGIYVFHIFALWASEEIMRRTGLDSALGKLALGILITIGLADVSYRLLERPFLRLKERSTVIQSRLA
ncbi:peptidoglycan/LPS O-acetylase OafA/YrhL [Pseudomonas sp. JAI111]|uniref:acyltransferase family protein n=1 Tax=Pseudomonas sp. JAI111 TaxID=2735913 RepID=UPI002167C85E|nr:acyltransferase [Pseudomonas sp. JAI111]MCS3839376.1 peptidoglycan/LPS O-acetylase OafA/YrhL [Pseudomonas sp. JAI111]